MGKKQPKIPEPPHPNDVNGDHFTTPGGKHIYDLVWGIHGRVSRLEAEFRIVMALLLLIVGLLFAVVGKDVL